MLTLGFHRVERPAGCEITRLAPARFKRLLEELGSWGTPVARLREPLAADTPQILLTFDDGYQSVAQNALPMLAARGWTAVVFLIAGAAGRSDDWDLRLLGRRRKMMNWSEVREWSSVGFEFGSHTITHPDLTALSDRSLRRELRESKAVIEDKLGRPARFLAYPFGRHDARVRAETERAGYHAAFAAGTGRFSDSFAVPRIMIHALTSIFELRTALKAELSADNFDKGCRGAWKSRFFQSLSAGSSTATNWRRLQRDARTIHTEAVSASTEDHCDECLH